ncbi:MAG: hypothetical protein AB1512_15430 [Thermodesulfobacteriota bacterium]
MTTEQEWQRAQRRVILYLRLLDMPALDALQAAMDALRLAQEEAGVGERNLPPMTLAMQCLRKVLEAMKGSAISCRDGEDLFRQMSPWSPPPEKDGVPCEAKSMPLIHRVSMVPERY